MDNIYYVIYGVLMLLSVFGLVVGVSNDACNFLNSSLGCRAATRNVVVAVAAIGVLLGASFSSGMMEIARSGVFVPSMFSFHEIMILFLAVMVANVILLDIFNTLGMPTSTTVSLIFALLGSALGMATYSMDIRPGSGMAEYINSQKALNIVAGIFASVGIAFVVGTIVMWFSRLLFSFRYQQTYKHIGPFWCAFAFTAISYFAIFKGLKDSAFKESEFLVYMNTHQTLFLAGTFVIWSIISYILQHIVKINTLRLTVLAGTGALALAFAGNDLVNFIGVFMAAQSSLGIAEAHVASGASLDTLMMGDLANPVQANALYLIAAGLIMVAALFFSKKARRVTETELKLSSSNAGKERFGSCSAARLAVRQTLNAKRFIMRITPDSIVDKVSARFKHLPPEEDTGAPYDQIRGSVNLTVAAILISVATTMKLPLSTTYVTFMVAMGSSLSDQAWGRESAVYRITGVLTVIGGWFLTAIAACTAAFLVALGMAYGGFWGIIALLLLAGFLLIKSTFFGSDEAKEVRLMDLGNNAAVHDFGTNAADRLGRMVGLYRAMVKALIAEDLDGLKRLRKKKRNLMQELKMVDENEVLPTLRNLPKSLADRGQLVVRISQISKRTCECLSVLIGASYNHIDNNHRGLSEAQGEDLLALAEKIGRFYPGLCDMLTKDDFEGIDQLMHDAHELGDDFADCITRHLMHSTEDEGCMRSGILYLTLLNETRAMVSHSFALIKRIKELFEG